MKIHTHVYTYKAEKEISVLGYILNQHLLVKLKMQWKMFLLKVGKEDWQAYL